MLECARAHLFRVCVVKIRRFKRVAEMLEPELNKLVAQN